MEIETAEIFAKASFKLTSEFTRVVPYLKANLDEKEYEVYAAVIFDILEKIDANLLSVVFDEHPEIKNKFDSNIEKYGFLP